MTTKTYNRPLRPGEIILEVVLPASGMKMSQLAAKLGIARQQLHSIMNYGKPVTMETATTLAAFCGNNAEDWIRWQSRYDFYIWKIGGFLNAKKRSETSIIEPNVDFVRGPDGEIKAKKYIDRFASRRVVAKRDFLKLTRQSRNVST